MDEMSCKLECVSETDATIEFRFLTYSRISLKGKQRSAVFVSVVY